MLKGHCKLSNNNSRIRTSLEKKISSLQSITLTSNKGVVVILKSHMSIIRTLLR